MDITIHTGLSGDRHKFRFDWFDHNNVHHETIMEVNVPWRDKPRGLEILANGVRIAEILSD